MDMQECKNYDLWMNEPNEVKIWIAKFKIFQGLKKIQAAWKWAMELKVETAWFKY